jgi:hypothetical protein
MRGHADAESALCWQLVGDRHEVRKESRATGDRLDHQISKLNPLLEDPRFADRVRSDLVYTHASFETPSQSNTIPPVQGTLKHAS